MRVKLMAMAGALALGMIGSAAHAATWVTNLDWAPNGRTGTPTPYGTVTVKELTPNDVRVTVALTSPALFSDNGNGHVMFAFNLADLVETTVTIDANSAIPQSQVTYSSDAADGEVYKNSPFGYFANRFEIVSSAPNTLPSPFIFTLHNSGGLTFAGTFANGQDADQDNNGTFDHYGAGNHFFSNHSGSAAGSPTGGWWFAVDTSGTVGGGCSPTCAVAGRDAILQDFNTVQTVVPEPATWAMMILGFGAAGAMLRRRRTVVA